MRPPQQRHAEKLLAAASALMIERNSIEISLSDLAQKSGVNAALVKYHFGNKEGAVAGAARARRAGAVQRAGISAGAADHAAGKAAAARRRHRQCLLPLPYMNRLIHLLLHDSSAQSAADQFRISSSSRCSHSIAGCWREGVAARRISSAVDPVFFYTHLVGACDHLVSWQACDVGGGRRGRRHRRRQAALHRAHDRNAAGWLAGAGQARPGPGRRRGSRRHRTDHSRKTRQNKDRSGEISETGAAAIRAADAAFGSWNSRASGRARSRP